MAITLNLAKKEAASKKQQGQMVEAQREAQRQQIANQQKTSQTQNEMYRQPAAPAPTKTPAPRIKLSERLQSAQNATKAKPAPRIKLSQRLQAAQNATRAKMASPAPTAPMPTTKAEKKITNNEPALVRIRADEERRQQAINKPRGAYKGALITKKVAVKKPTVKKVAVKKVTPKKK